MDGLDRLVMYLIIANTILLLWGLGDVRRTLDRIETQLEATDV